MANLVTFVKKLWKDATSGGTPITAAELNRMEGGINDCATQINKLGDSVSRVTTFLTGTTDNAINISFERNVRACALVLMDGNGNPSLLFVNGVKKSFTLLAGAQRNVTWSESGTSVAIESVTWNSVTVLSTTTVKISVA